MDKKNFEVKLGQYDPIYFNLIIDHQEYQIAWENCSSKLAAASRMEREFVEVSPSGYGLHWPLLDEDLAIRPLLAACRGEFIHHLPAADKSNI